MEFNSEPVHNKKYLKAENIYIYIYIYIYKKKINSKKGFRCFLYQ